MHWTERRRAKALVADELARRGWTLYGYKPDRSDGMTDYYDPASWDGIAEKDGFVAVVDVGKSNHYILSRSGGRRYTERVRDKHCERCAGSGQEPEGWTYDEAIANPREFAHWQLNLTGHLVTPVLSAVVSPHDFKDGRYKCRACQGAGCIWKEVEAVEPWPVFQHCAPGRLWHVEKDGRVLASGVGLGPCSDYHSKRAQAAVEQLVNRIEDALRSGPAGLTRASFRGGGATIRHNERLNGIEVQFAAKPAEEVRAGLKDLGFHWSKRQGLWYARFTEMTWGKVHDLVGETPKEEPESSADHAAEPERELEQSECPGAEYVIVEPLTGQVVSHNCISPASVPPSLPPVMDVMPEPLADAAITGAGAGQAAQPLAPSPALASHTLTESDVGWTVLTRVKWRGSQPVAPRGIIDVRSGAGEIHRLTPYGTGLWCMSCGSETCPAGDAVLATRPAARTKPDRAA